MDPPVRGKPQTPNLLIPGKNPVGAHGSALPQCHSTWIADPAALGLLSQTQPLSWHKRIGYIIAKSHVYCKLLNKNTLQHPLNRINEFTTSSENCSRYMSSVSEDLGRMQKIVKKTMPLVTVIHITGMTGILHLKHLTVWHLTQGIHWCSSVSLSIHNHRWYLRITQ